MEPYPYILIYTNYNSQKGLKIMQDFFNILDWMQLLRTFIVGGLICVIGQLLIDKTKLTPARILVAFVTTGAILRRSSEFINI